MPAPTTPNLAYKVEQWGIDMLAEHAGIPNGFQIAHHFEDPRANVNRIFLTARVGDREEGGCEPFNVSLEVKLTMTERDAGKVEDIFRAIEETFRTFPPVASLNQFAYVTFLPPGEDDKDTTKEQRTIARTFNFHALEAV